MFPAIEPFQVGYLPVTDGNEIYFEVSGNPEGKPALFLHGGPGAGILAGYRRRYDPKIYRIVSFEQRGCGRSRPSVIADGALLATNNTDTLISDIERLREYLSVESWLVTGMSWGTTLALAYAQAHPDRARAIVACAITTTTRFEVEWLTEQMRRLFPEEWHKFAKAVGAEPGQRLIDLYYRDITDNDSSVRLRAAQAWCKWEDVHVSLGQDPGPGLSSRDYNDQLVFSTLVIHYWKHAAFIPEPGILGKMKSISGIPAVLIHGRMDISSPLETAWNLHKAGPSSELIIVEDEGHVGEKMIAEFIRAIARFSHS